jgi:hypothetical protein
MSKVPNLSAKKIRKGRKKDGGWQMAIRLGLITKSI